MSSMFNQQDGAQQGPRAEPDAPHRRTPEGAVSSDFPPIDDHAFRRFAEHMPILCWMADADGSIFWYNRRWYDYTGAMPEQLLGWGWRTVHHPDLLPSVMARWTSSIATGEPFDMTVPLRAADGTFRPFLTRIEPVRDAAGAVTRWFGVNVDVSAQFAAEAALRASELQHKTLTEMLPQLVWTCLPDGRCDYLSRQWADYTGMPAADQLGLDWLDLVVHPDDRDRTYAHWMGAVGGEHPYDIEYRIRRHDGAYRWFKTRGTPVCDESGRIMYWFGTCTDIQDIVEAREVLDRSREELERLVAERTAERDRTWRNTQDLLAVTDVKGDFRAINPAWTTVLGWRLDELLGRNFLEFIHPDDHAPSRSALSRATTDVLKGYENRFREKAGGYRWISWLASPEGDAVYASGRDVTSEKAAVDALERSEALMRSVFETSYQHKGLLTPEGVLLDANPTSLASIQCRLDDVVGKPFWETPWFAGTPGMSEHVRVRIPLVASGQVVRDEITVNLPGGRRSFDFSMRPVRNAAGEVIAIVPEAMDLTERRAAEEALRQSQKMEAVGQLTGGIAHDFNNMLAIVIGSLELLDRRLDSNDPRLRRHLASAMEGADRAKTLTQRLLAFSRQQPLDPRPIDVNALVAEMSDMTRRALGELVAMDTALAANLWRTRADPHQLESAILNLVVNARDAMPGGGRLLIETHNVYLDERYPIGELGLSSGEYVMIGVADTGAGMPPEVIARAFEPFFTTKEVGKGTGLGLSQVYGFVKQSGGHVKIESDPGSGSTVRIYLPRHNASGADNADAAREGPAPQLKTPHETILVVEDEAAVRRFSVDALAELGYRVLEAENAAAAPRIIDAHPEVALLFTDIVMPQTDGRALFETAQRLRPQLKALFTTGYAGSAAAAPGRDGRVMAKPFTIAELAAKVRDALDF